MFQKVLKILSFTFNYGDFEKLKKLIKEKNIGTIKMEVCRSLNQIFFFKKSERYFKVKNIVLIFDECTSGFRENFGGLQKKIDVKS